MNKNRLHPNLPRGPHNFQRRFLNLHVIFFRSKVFAGIWLKRRDGCGWRYLCLLVGGYSSFKKLKVMKISFFAEKKTSNAWSYLWQGVKDLSVEGREGCSWGKEMELNLDKDQFQLEDSWTQKHNISYKDIRNWRISNVYPIWYKQTRSRPVA